MVNIDKSIVDKSLKKVLKTTGIVFIGSVTGLFLQFISGIIITRAITPKELGVYTLSFTIISSITLISFIGFDNGMPRMVAKYFTTKDYGKTWGIVLSAFFIVCLMSILCSTGNYFLSGYIAQTFKKPDMQRVLQFFTFVLPPMAISMLLVNTFRGLSYSWPKVVVDEVSIRVFRIMGLFFVIYTGAGLKGVLWAHTLVIYFVSTCFLIYSSITIPKIIPRIKPEWDVTGGLIKFSLPLFGNTIVSILKMMAGIMILGYYLPYDAVAQYNVSMSLAHFLDMPLTSMAFIYLPTATSLLAASSEQDLNAAGKLYTNCTKWIALIAVPFFMVFLLDADFLVTKLFGEAYLPAAKVLRILSIGYFIHVSFGPNGLTLLSLGKSKVFLSSALAMTALNIVLGIFLIPRWNIQGAAAANCISLIVSNLILSLSLYRFSRIHPLSMNYLKPFAFIFALSFLAYYIFNLCLFTSVFGHIVFLTGLVCICICAPFITRSINADDLSIISAMERKFSQRSIISEKLSRWYGVEISK
ncbi:MAG: flippase [Candidatus Brocadiaceae bacterium]